MLFDIKKQLISALDSQLIDALLKAYNELKNQYYLGKHKPSELDAGHFAELVIRLLQYITTPDHSFTPLGRRLRNLDRQIDHFAQLPEADFHDSIRLHIPRAIHAIYGIRSRRGVAHVGGDVSPNLPDSSLVIAICDWILTELIRLYYTTSVEDAQKLVDSLVERKVPLIQDFNGHLKVLDPNLSVPTKILVLLYYRGEEGASLSELRRWIKTKSSSHIPTAIKNLQHKKGHVHRDNSRCYITRTGILFVENNIPLSFPP